jgi:hypothetical protein
VKFCEGRAAHSAAVENIWTIKYSPSRKAEVATLRSRRWTVAVQNQRCFGRNQSSGKKSIIHGPRKSQIKSYHVGLSHINSPLHACMHAFPLKRPVKVQLSEAVCSGPGRETEQLTASFPMNASVPSRPKNLYLPRRIWAEAMRLPRGKVVPGPSSSERGCVLCREVVAWANQRSAQISHTPSEVLASPNHNNTSVLHGR